MTPQGDSFVCSAPVLKKCVAILSQGSAEGHAAGKPETRPGLRGPEKSDLSLTRVERLRTAACRARPLTLRSWLPSPKDPPHLKCFIVFSLYLWASGKSAPGLGARSDFAKQRDTTRRPTKRLLALMPTSSGRPAHLRRHSEAEGGMEKSDRSLQVGGEREVGILGILTAWPDSGLIFDLRDILRKHMEGKVRSVFLNSEEDSYFCNLRAGNAPCDNLFFKTMASVSLPPVLATP